MFPGEFDKIKTDVLQCTKCILYKTRNKPIFGEGNPQAKILLIGEAPGRDEDLIGRPFVGKSGKLLDKILAACYFNRNDHVFISNIVKCRPPGNRLPTNDEVKICIPYLYKQIECIDPVILILLGSIALKSLLGNDKKITQLRGNWIKWNDRWVMPVYHPAALLRNPALKRETWEDYKKVVYKYRELVEPDHYSKYMQF